MKLLKNIFLASALVLPLACINNVSANEGSDGHKGHSRSLISVVGESRLEVEPDQVTINLKAQYSASKQDEANREINKQFSRLTDYLLDVLKLDKSKVIAENLVVFPVYKYEDNKEPVLVKYTATRNLKVTLTDFTLIDKVVNTSLKNSSFTITGTSYSLQNPSSYATKVRKMAIDDSIAKAKELAKAYNAEVIKVHKIDYTQNYQLLEVNTIATPRLMSSKMNTQDDGLEPSFFNPQKIELNDKIQVQFVMKANNL